MQSIADISIFKTPFESEGSFRTKFDRIRTMFEDYLVNAWMDLESEISQNDTFTTKRYFDPERRLVEVSFSFQKNLSEMSYFPAGMVNYQLNPFSFQKENIEHFLNDNIAFIWNVFGTEFFIDFHSDYRLDDRNRGKKLDYTHLKSFDTENPKSDTNKQLLDSLMYVYFGLMKNLYDLENNSEKLDRFLKNATLSDMGGTFGLFALRGDKNKEALASQADIVRKQIDTFVWLISAPPEPKAPYAT